MNNESAVADLALTVIVAAGVVLLFAVCSVLLRRNDRLTNVQRLFVAGGGVAGVILLLPLF